MQLALILNLRFIVLISFFSLLIFLVFKLYFRERELNRFLEFHKRTSTNIISGINNENYPFFRDDRLNIMENNIRAIDKYINEEKHIIVEDKLNLQAIISDISHQAKTPISNIKMINEILLNRQLNEKQVKDFITSMDDEINKLDFLMQSMITISFLETGIMKFNHRLLPIYDTIVYSLNSSISLINKKEIDIKVSCKDDLFVKHDPKWTGEAICNVLNNATKFSPPKSSIIIKVVQEQFYTSISVKDSGTGIPKENLKNIFNKFYTNDKENGSGIGLHLTERIIKGQNGYINVNSEVNHGTEFIMYLPNN